MGPQASECRQLPQHQARPLGISRSSAAGGWRRREVGPWSFVMSRMVSVWLPALPIERLKRMRHCTPFPVDRPFALVGSEDRELVERVQRGVRSQGLASGVLLPESERLIAHFQALVAAAIGPS